MSEEMTNYTVIPEGDNVDEYTSDQSRVAAVSPEDAVLAMARRDYQTFGSAEDNYDVYKTAKKPVFVWTYPRPAEDLLKSDVGEVRAVKAESKCTHEHCSHGTKATQETVEALLIVLGGDVSLAKGLIEHLDIYVKDVDPD